jgi:cytidyltransferase-like protein
MNRKILIMGLPGAGKTCLSKALAPLLNAVHFNADDVRANVNKDLGFSVEDRIEQARRMGWLCDRVTEAGGWAIADFVCPTPETRAAFGEATVIWVDRIQTGRFEDTNKLFIRPEKYYFHVPAEGTPEYWANQICAALLPVFNPKKPTALFLGRYQPFHAGHKALIEEGLRRVGQVCIAVRDTQGIDTKNPFDFLAVKARIEASLAAWAGHFLVVPLPNITNIFYGRDVGYKIEELVMPQEIQDISATKIRGLIENFKPVCM